MKKYQLRIFVPSFQKAAVDVPLTNTVEAAAKENPKLSALPSVLPRILFLRESFEKTCSDTGIKLLYPPFALCTDNAAMIASAAYFPLYVKRTFAPKDLNAIPGLKLGEKY